MRLNVKNFGPIVHANVNITPITVIIGRNNLGKSFLSQLIFSLLSSIKSPKRAIFGVSGWETIGITDIPPGLFTENEDINKSLMSFRKGSLSLTALLDTSINQILKMYAHYMRLLLGESLERTYGVKIEELIHIGAESSNILFKASPYMTFQIKITRDGKLLVSVQSEVDRLLKMLLKDRRISNDQKFLKQTRASEKDLSYLFFSIKKHLFHQYNSATPYYIPAGRAGLLESWDTIASAWINLAPISIPRGISMPPLPGMSARFYNILYSLTGRKKGAFHNLSKPFTSILGGELEVSPSADMKGRKEIFYSFRTGDVVTRTDIIHTASMIKEIGPLYLIIKETLERNDFFIVEEPESHLHPTAQRDLVRIFVTLVERGVDVLFTTHSDLLLRTVVHNVVDSYHRGDKSSISLRDLSIYLLKSGTRESQKGSIAQKIRTSKHGSIDKLPTFDEVMEELYDEEMRLEIMRNV